MNRHKLAVYIYVTVIIGMTAGHITHPKYSLGIEYEIKIITFSVTFLGYILLSSFENFTN